jgi:hypothetical protein
MEYWYQTCMTLPAGTAPWSTTWFRLNAWARPVAACRARGRVAGGGLPGAWGAGGVVPGRWARPGAWARGAAGRLHGRRRRRAGPVGAAGRVGAMGGRQPGAWARGEAGRLDGRRRRRARSVGRAAV